MKEIYAFPTDEIQDLCCQPCAINANELRMYSCKFVQYSFCLLFRFLCLGANFGTKSVILSGVRLTRWIFKVHHWQRVLRWGHRTCFFLRHIQFRPSYVIFLSFHWSRSTTVQTHLLFLLSKDGRIIIWFGRLVTQFGWFWRIVSFEEGNVWNVLYFKFEIMEWLTVCYWSYGSILSICKIQS